MIMGISVRALLAFLLLSFALVHSGLYSKCLDYGNK